MSEINVWLFQALNLSEHAPPAWVAFARFAALQLPAALLLMVLACLATGSRRWIAFGLELLAAMALAWLAARLVQQIWPMPRPFVLDLGQRWVEHAASPSFPSTHASVVSALAMLAWLRLPLARLRWPILMAALLVAWSRIAVGVHFPVDVLAGWTVGTCAAWVVHRVRPRQLPTSAVPAQI